MNLTTSESSRVIAAHNTCSFRRTTYVMPATPVVSHFMTPDNVEAAIAPGIIDRIMRTGPTTANCGGGDTGDHIPICISMIVVPVVGKHREEGRAGITDVGVLRLIGANDNTPQIRPQERRILRRMQDGLV